MTWVRWPFVGAERAQGDCRRLTKWPHHVGGVLQLTVTRQKVTIGRNYERVVRRNWVHRNYHTKNDQRMSVSEELRQKLSSANQAHLLKDVDQLSEAEAARYLDELSRLDLDRVVQLFQQRTAVAEESEAVEAEGDVAEAAEDLSVAERAHAPANVVRLPTTPEEEDEWEQAVDIGYGHLGVGKVGAILVAGGQGTRLGFDQPKGMYPIGPVSGASLFQTFAEQILARSEDVGAPIPYYIMTSDSTHEETVAFFEQNNFFGLDPANVFFFRQGTMPAIDAETGEILRTAPGKIALSPDGHGGLVAALKQSGALDDMVARGLDVLYYHQVDNPTAIVCDPAFIGMHITQGSEMSTKVVAKRHPTERMGVLCDLDGTTRIIEYSDLPAEYMDRHDANGQPVFWAGNTAMHVFSLSLLQRLCDGEHDLPFHVAHKPVTGMNARGEHVIPEGPNAFKFERFIFDALPEAKRPLILEADRSREFNPVKNAEGDDSPETASAALVAIAKSWLIEAGAELADGILVEISPLFALDAEEIRRKVQDGERFKKDVYLRD